MPKNKKTPKGKKIMYSLGLIPLIVILLLFAFFLANIFEGERPLIDLQPLPEFLTGSQEFNLKISDMKRGLKRLKVYVSQEGREITIFEKKFPFKGLLNREGAHQFETEIIVNPSKLNLVQGRVDLNARVWDYSRRGGGDGNRTLAHHKMIVDTIPPALGAISRMHNINLGGTGLIVYQTSSDAQESGVFIDDIFFPGFPADPKSPKGIHVCYFVLPYDSSLNPSVSLWAKDRAGNQQRTHFYTHIRKKRFRKERVKISDKFLNRVLPYFSYYIMGSQESDMEKYVRINRDLRKKSHEIFVKLKENTSPEKLWEGPWLRLKNAAPMSRFADHRSYYYHGEQIDEQVHLGVDLASLAHAPVQAANNGKVIFAERNGIYGLSVVLDHGQGLSSIYGHLSRVEVTPNQEVKKRDIIGHTGQTGLAGGDHLHFAVMINSVFADPIEWWDSHWIEDNITKKLALIENKKGDVH